MRDQTSDMPVATSAAACPPRILRATVANSAHVPRPSATFRASSCTVWKSRTQRPVLSALGTSSIAWAIAPIVTRIMSAMAGGRARRSGAVSPKLSTAPLDISAARSSSRRFAGASPIREVMASGFPVAAAACTRGPAACSLSAVPGSTAHGRLSAEIPSAGLGMLLPPDSDAGASAPAVRGLSELACCCSVPIWIRVTASRIASATE